MCYALSSLAYIRPSRISMLCPSGDYETFYGRSYDYDLDFDGFLEDSYVDGYETWSDCGSESAMKLTSATGIA